MRRTQPPKPAILLQPEQSEWKVEKLVPGGAGFLRLANGQGAFAPGALPGERIRVELAEDHQTYLQATRWRLLEASPDRVQPVCPVQGSCGGCDLMTLDYPAQLSQKLGILRDALTRTGRFQELPELSFVAAEQPLAYRSRIRLHIAEDGRLGFFAAESRELVEVPGCLVADPELDQALLTLRSITSQHRTELASFSELELRVAPAGPRLALRLLPVGRHEGQASALIAALSRVFQVSVGERSSAPEYDQRFPLPGGVELRVPAAGFTQVHWAVNQRLVQAVLDGAEQRAVSTFCDLYCGAGNFSLPLAARGKSGVGIEGSKLSIAAAKRASAEQGFTRVRFIAGDVKESLAKLSRAESFDLVLLDPPRSGAREVLSEVIRRAPRHIAYCACDPVTLARDLRTLCDSGYILSSVAGFDMFPQTHHFETLAWLSHPG
ncbi:MAG TPA: class I SAM-dependent RNA methyltransferase [Polyangiaceae bacterium]|nr:class I SAM-dependent RNA methyltransferase [Polyangiaceae bacterium]